MAMKEDSLMVYLTSNGPEQQHTMKQITWQSHDPPDLSFFLTACELDPAQKNDILIRCYDNTRKKQLIVAIREKCIKYCSNALNMIR